MAHAVAGSSLLSLTGLEVTFKWELRMLYLVPAVIVFPLIHNAAGHAVAVVGMILTIALDTCFTIIVSAIFLGPIIDALGNAGLQVQSDAYKNLQKTKYLTVIGASMVVFSSTLLYVNLILKYSVEGLFHSSPWLNPYVFGGSANSVANDVGMFLLSGVLKQMTWAPVSTHVTKWLRQSRGLETNEVAVMPASVVFESQAHEPGQ